MTLDLRKALKNLNLDVDWIGLREVQEKSTRVNIRNGRPETNSFSIDQGIMVEVLKSGMFGYAATSDLTQEGIKRAAFLAKKNAETFSPFKIYNFSEKQRPKAQGHFISPFNKDLDRLSLSEINDFLSLCCDRMGKRKEVINCLGLAVISDIKTNFVSSNDSDFSSNIKVIQHELSVTSKKNSEIQSRSWGNVAQVGLELFNKELFLFQANRILEESIELLDAPECPNEEMDLILMPDQMILQIHESIGHPLEMDRILGDERNYAGWSFISLKDFGNLKYGSELLNITFDPTVQGQLASYDYDDTGNKATKEYLIKDGVLLRGLGSLESQVRSKVMGVANSRATSWNRAPIDRMANINLEPGNNSLSEMIESTQKGIIMHTNRSWSIDDYRNKFQFGCEYAQLIEEGKITKTLKNPNYRGITNSFWNKLKMVGDKSSFEVMGTPNCGKGEPNQVIRVGHASPACLFSQVEVFGGV